MSTVSKAGPSRIPTFGSRLPQPTTPKLPSFVDSTKRYVGKRVRFNDKEGLLRFIGSVHFSTGVWCGIELTDPVGKNDGTVQGVRYFDSAKNCGLMAPLSKVSLIEDNWELLNEDPASGPYSMLFIDGDFDTVDANLSKSFSKDDNKINRTISRSLNFTQTISERKANLTLNTSTNKILSGSREILIDTEIVSSDITFSKPSNQTFKSSNPQINETFNRNENISLSEQNSKSNVNERTAPDSSKKRGVDRRRTFTRLQFSTPTRPDDNEQFLKKLRISAIHACEDESKRSSLEFDDSLGILTPEQMEATLGNTNSSLDVGLIELLVKNGRKSELPSPRDESLGADSLAEPSLGILDDQLLGNITLYTDTSNMKIHLENKTEDILTRIEQTPSPEELPFDPTPIVEITDPKLEATKVKTTNSFITSVTSITSLDTGYQGDGEMSRPASRGAEGSPLTRRPVPRPQVRNNKADPMTDSDFYTESDADVQEENPLRGDRKAQVIDGTLYGVDPQATADLYMNNRENMDSSGIFTDLDSARNEEDSSIVEIPAPSPSEASTKTISENSQRNVREILERSEKKEQKNPLPKDNPKKRNAPSPGVTSPSSFSSPRHGVKDEHAAKKYKIPKREIASKVKSNLETTHQQSREKIAAKKPVNKWDAVMNKISKTEQSKTNFKNVKSKVFSDLNVNKMQTPENAIRQSEVKKIGVRNNTLQKTSNNKTVTKAVSRLTPCSSQILPAKSGCSTPVKRPASAQSLVTKEKRRVRRNPRQNDYEDNSTTSSASGSSRRPAGDPQLVLTANKIPPKVQQNQTPAQQSKATNTDKTPQTKDATTLTEESPLVVDVLGVVIQHLSFGVVPRLETKIDLNKTEIRKLKEHCQQLEKLLTQERQKRAVENERYKHLEEEYESRKNEMNTAMGHLERILKEETEKHKEALQNEKRHYKLEIRRLLESFKNYLDNGTGNEMHFVEELRQSEAKLVENHKDLEQILVDNDKKQELYYFKSLTESLRNRVLENEQNIQRKNKELEVVRKENQKFKQQVNTMKEQCDKYRKKCGDTEQSLQNKLRVLEEENSRLRDENGRLISLPEYANDQEERSFQTLAEIKQHEVDLLRKTVYEANQKLEELEIYLDRSQVLSARVEDLELQLHRKTELEQSLIQEKKKLEELLREEINQKRRALQFNEELQWKLKQNKEVINKILGHSEDINFSRSVLSASYNERHNMSRNSLERSLSFREKNTIPIDDRQKSRKSRNFSDFDWDEVMGPTSPKVKSVVEKSESLSYVLDLDDSPDVVASRIIRRSFRQNTPPKTHFLKSPSNKKRNPLSQSASSSAILSPASDKSPSISPSINNRQDQEDQIFSWEEDPRYSEPEQVSVECKKPVIKEEFSKEDFSLPPLPTEGEGAQHLPPPKLLAHEIDHEEFSDPCSVNGMEEKSKQSSEDEEDESTDM